MPIIGAVIGAIMTGLLYWFIWGGGMDYVDAMLRDRKDKKRKAALRKETGTPALRALKDPREAATALMVGAALARGVPTPEQLTYIGDQLRGVFAFPDAEAATRLISCRHAAEQAPSPEAIVDDVAETLRETLDPHEREELRGMLEAVGALHGGPTERQERFVALAMRRLGVTA